MPLYMQEVEDTCKELDLDLPDFFRDDLFKTPEWKAMAQR
jgi:uncharacterized protein YebE (UPF0316 family)